MPSPLPRSCVCLPSQPDKRNVILRSFSCKLLRLAAIALGLNHEHANVPRFIQVFAVMWTWKITVDKSSTCFPKDRILTNLGINIIAELFLTDFLVRAQHLTPKTLSYVFRGRLTHSWQNAFDSCLTQPTHHSEWFHLHWYR